MFKFRFAAVTEFTPDLDREGLEGAGWFPSEWCVASVVPRLLMAELKSDVTGIDLERLISGG